VFGIKCVLFSEIKINVSFKIYPCKCMNIWKINHLQVYLPLQWR
jgi:hypothetical protein